MSEQVHTAAGDAITAGEQAVDWIEAQPGGQQTMDTVAAAGADLDAAIGQQPWAGDAGAAATQTARDVVDAAQNTPETAEVANAVVDVIDHQPPFAPGQFGVFTPAANAALAAAQEVTR